MAELDGRSIKGHADDYWIFNLQEGPDPFEGNRTEHAAGDCTSDFIKTGRWEHSNVDGSTTFYNDKRPRLSSTGTCRPAGTYFCKLEDVSYGAMGTLHGPVSQPSGCGE